MCVFIGAQSNPAADARKDEEIRSLQDQLEKMRLDNANKDSAIEKLVSNEIKMFEARLKYFSYSKVNWGAACCEADLGSLGVLFIFHLDTNSTQSLMLFLFQKTDVTVLEARVVNSSEEDKENIVPSESEILQNTISRLQSDLQELRTSAAEKDNEISRLSVQNNEAEGQIQSLVSIWDVERFEKITIYNCCRCL